MTTLSPKPAHNNSDSISSKVYYPTTIISRCNRKYIKIDKPDLSVSKTDTANTFMGKVAHKVLKEIFSLNTPILKRGPETVPKRVREIWKTVPVFIRRKFFGHPEDEKRYGNFVITVLQNYLSCVDLTVQPLFVDEYFQMELNEYCCIGGRIDRVDQSEIQKLKIIEYKFSRAALQNQETLLNRELQISWYTLLIKRRFPYADISFEIHFLPKNEIVKIVLDENFLKRQKLKIEQIVMENI